MPDTRQGSVDPEFPSFDASKVYLVKGSTLNKLAAVIRRNRPRAVTGGGIRIAQETQEGEWLALDADELTLNVCIGGVSTPRTFYVKRSASG